MDIKKSKLLEDRFELPSFSLIYNVNAGNQTVTVVTLLCYVQTSPISFVQQRK